MINRLVDLASIGSSLANVALLQRFLSGMAGVIALTVLSTIMASAVLVCGLYAIYAALVSSGVSGSIALLSISLTMLVLTGMLAWLALRRFRQLRDLPQRFLMNETPFMAGINDIFHAFMDGLKKEERPKP